MQQKKIFLAPFFIYEIVIEIGLSLDRKIALLDTCYSFYAKKCTSIAALLTFATGLLMLVH